MAQSTWKVKESKVTFHIRNAGFKVDGFFKGFSADISFSKNKLESSSIKASIEANTINTDNSWRDNHLRKEEYFYVSKYPTINMKSVSFSKVSDTNFKGTFDLTLRGVTKRITFPFTFSNNTFKGSFTINRLDYKVGGKSVTMSNNATITLEVKVTQ